MDSDKNDKQEHNKKRKLTIEERKEKTNYINKNIEHKDHLKKTTRYYKT